jgi:carnitine 3-dehydrogenase / betainyl-CoA thioesterase
MALVEPGAVRRVAIVGAGVIGSGWALHYLRMGFDVDVYDPARHAERDLLRTRDAAWPLLERMGLRPGASPDRITFHAGLAGAVAGADMVQENAPEDGPTKRRVLAEIDAAAPPEVVIASSTSGFAMSMLQADCASPQRCVVGHPFNPPYLIPLVEVTGGEKTDPAAVDWLAAFYAGTGKRALRLSRELPGFVANRLQEAMWREALHMVAAGEATVEEIDASIVYGPGLRWAQMGPCLTFHLAGGSGGMAHMLDHFGAALIEPWTRLQAPPLTPELRQRMVDGCAAQARGRSVAELERLRDEFLAELLGLVERYGTEATVPARVSTPYAGAGAAPWREGQPIPAPLRLHETTVRAEWVDYNGHLSESVYLLIFGDSSDAFFRFFGVDEKYRASGHSLYTVETHMRNLREVSLGERLRLSLQVLGVDAKRVHIAHEMHNAAGDVVATAEQMLLHVDTRAGNVTPFPAEIARRLQRIGAAHAALEAPNHVMRIPGR